MSRPTRNILGEVALALVVLGILPLVLGVVHLILSRSNPRFATFRVTVILVGIGAAGITAGMVLDRWVRQRIGEAPRGFSVVVREPDNAKRP